MMSNICSKCNKDTVLKQETQIQIDAITFTIKPDMFCLSCSEKDLKREIECLLKKKGEWYTQSNNEININWRKIEEFEEGYKDCAYEILLAMKIFSLSSEDNWLILTDGAISLNPNYSSFILYFTNKKDVIAFAQETLNKTRYRWTIYFKTEKISKDSILARP